MIFEVKCAGPLVAELVDSAVPGLNTLPLTQHPPLNLLAMSEDEHKKGEALSDELQHRQPEDTALTSRTNVAVSTAPKKQAIVVYEGDERWRGGNILSDDDEDDDEHPEEASIDNQEEYLKDYPSDTEVSPA